MSAVEPDRRTKLALCFSVAAMFVLAVIAIHFRSSSDTAHRSESKTDEEAAVVIGEGDAATPGVIVGRVFLENKKKPERDRGAGAPRGEASTDGGDEPAGTSTGSGAVDSSGEGSDGARDGQGEEVHVEPASGCVVTLWRSGQRLQDGACTGDGRFRLELAEGAMEESPDAVTSIEITVPRYLRASLALTGEEAVPLKGVGNTLDLGDVALGSAVPLRGVVLDAEGEGVADVVVEAMPIEHLDEPEPWRARTNAAGEFEYRTLPRGPLRIELRDPRYAPSVVEAVAPYDAVVLPVSRYKTVTGEVDLEAIASAGAMPIVARIQGSGVWPPRTVKVAEDGSFRFEEIPDGVYAVEVLAIAEGDKASFVSDIVEGVMPDQPVSLTLRPAGWIRVQVTDTDGQPLPGARVTAGFGGLSMLQKVGETDRDGFATVGPLALGPHMVAAAADGYLSAPELSVEVTPASDRAAVPVRLSRPQTLRGRVVDPQGAPSTTAEVELLAERAFSLGQGEVAARVFSTLVRASTGSLGVTTGPVPEIPLFTEPADTRGDRMPVDDQGEFAFGGLIPGEYTLIAYDAGYARSTPVLVRVPEDAADVVVLTLREGVLVEGRITDARGAPLENAVVQVLEDGSEVRSDDRGHFDIGTRNGPLSLVVRAPGYVPQRVARRAGDRAVFVDIALRPATGRFAGRVRDGNDRVVEGAIVRLSYTNSWFLDRVMVSDTRGLVGAEELVEGRASLEIAHPDYVPVALDVTVSSAGDLVETTLVSGWKLRVEVRDQQRGDFISGARLRVDGRGARTDSKGGARFVHLPPGPALLEVSAVGYVTARETLRGDEDEVVERLVELVEGGRIEGQVRDDLGDAVGNVTVEVFRPGGREVLGLAKTDARGRFQVDSLPVGEIEVIARVPAGGQELWVDARLASDVLGGQVTRDVFLRFDRRAPQN